MKCDLKKMGKVSISKQDFSIYEFSRSFLDSTIFYLRRVRDFIRLISRNALRFVPIQYLQDPIARITLWKWLFIGLFVRFLFMPFACHADLLSQYWRAHMLAYHSYLSYAYSFIDSIHAFFLVILRPLMPADLDSHFHPWGSSYLIEKYPLTYGFGTSTVTDWLTFVQQDAIFRVLFLFKLPYLILDIFTAILLLHILRTKNSGLLAFKLWMINPVIIYSAYIFGRGDILALLFISLFFYFINKGNDILASLSIGAAIISRTFPLLLLPLILLIKKSYTSMLKIAIFSLLPIFLWEIFAKAAFIGTETATKSISLSERFLNATLGLRLGNLSIFLVSYVILLLITAFLSFNNSSSDRFKIFNTLNDRFLIVFCLFFSFSSFSLHFFAWITPFLIIRATKNRDSFYAYIFVILGWLVFAFSFIGGFLGGSIVGLGLFASIDTTLVNYPTLIDMIVQVVQLEYATSATIGRSIFSATLLFMIYTIMREYIHHD